MDSAGSDPSEEPPGGRGRSRTESRNRFVEWVLVDGDRLRLTLGGAVAVFALLSVLFHLDVIAFTNDDSVTRMASGMIAGTFSLVTLVVSVNQLILSQKFTPAGEFRDRIGGVLKFLEDIEEAAGVPTAPAAPTRVLQLLAAAIQHRATALADAVADRDDQEYRDRVTRYATRVADSAERLAEDRDHGDVSAFQALSTAIEYDHDWQLYAARHLRNDAPAPSEETDGAFDDLIEVLMLFSIAQEHFKTIYLQRELTRFSQLTIYCGMPAVLAAILIVLLYGDLGGATLSIAYLPHVTMLLVTIVAIPLVLLAAFILRTATLVRRTAAIGPMLPQKDPAEGPFDISYADEE